MFSSPKKAESPWNPLRVRLHLSWPDYLRIVLLSVTLVPLRLLSLLLCFILAWLTAKVALLGADLSQPLTGRQGG